MRKSVFLYTFLSILLFSSIVYIPVNAQIYDMQLKTDKTTYNVGETVKITGNVTLDGIPVDDAIVAIEIDSPYGNPYVIRTVQTGEDTSRYWRLTITDLYPCDSQGNPKNLFNKGQLAYVAMKIKNIGTTTLPVKTALYVQCSDNTPLIAFYPFAGEIEGGHEPLIISSVPISANAPSGQATIFAGLFFDSPKLGGTAYCKDKTASFYIASTTPPAQPQPQYFNITFALPVKDLPRGKYTIYGATKYETYISIKIKQFTVIGPVPIITYYPNNPIVCQTVTFNGSASYDVNGTITDWYWQFGDGTTARGTVVTHIYEIAGYQLVTLTVTDNDGGSNSTGRIIKVLEAWPMFHHDLKRSGSSTSLAPVTNRTIWSKVIGPINTDFWMYSSAAVTTVIMGNAVFIGSTNGTIYAFNATNGAVIWKKTPAPGYKIYSSPAFAEGLVFIGSEDGHIYVLNATNGNIKYNIATGNPVYSSAVAVGSRVYIGSHDAKVYAFYTNGTNLWTSNALDGAIDLSPAVASGKVFVGTYNGTVYALNETTGAIVWRTNLAPGIRIYSSPAFADNRIFIGSTDNKVYALSSETGSVVWNVATSGEVYSSPAVAHGVVFIGSMDNNLYALNVATGALVWSKPVGQIKWSSPLVAEGKVFIGTRDGKVYALREKNGEVWWSYQTNGAVDSSPAVLSDTLYVSSKDGKLYAFSNQIHDVAVTSVIPSRTLVFQSETVTINAILWNKGSFNEVVNLSTSYNNTIFNTASVSLSRGSETTIQISFNTIGVSAGNYMIHVNASLTPPITDENPSDNTKTCQIRIEIGRHEIILTNATPSTLGIDPTKPIPLKNVLGRGYNVPIYVTVKNQGNFTERNIQVDIYWSNSTHFNQTINSVIIPELVVDASIMFNITWNTNGFAYGNYAISAYAKPVSGENNRTNNMYVVGIVRVGVPGDVTSAKLGVPEGKVDMRDIGVICNKFGTKPSSPKWDPNKDINSDGKVDMRDIGIVCSNYGKTEK